MSYSARHAIGFDTRFSQRRIVLGNGGKSSSRERDADAGRRLRDRLVSPRPGSPLASPSTEFRLDEFENVTFRPVNAALYPYNTPADYDKEKAAREVARGDA